jgi:mono/diheme cytochrome c family protein
VTEIPEHLLKRSQERRAALSGESAPADAPADAATPATVEAAAAPATAPRPAAPARAEPAVPPPPKPDPPYIAAAKNRKKIPFWAMATLSLLPIWGFMYVQGLKPEAVVVAGPVGDGKKLYSSCATCHGADGSGGVGRPFINGSVQKTFPHIEDQLNLVYIGSQAYRDSGVGPYGDPSVNHLGYNGSFMPSQKDNLTQDQILAVVCHERYDLGGANPDDPAWAAEYTKWCSEDSAIYEGLKDGSLTFDNLSEKVPDTLTVGTAPRPGTPATPAGE